MRRIYLKSAGLFLMGLFLGLATAGFYFQSEEKNESSSRRRELHAGQKGFINPLIDCADSSEQQSPIKAQLKGRVQDLIAKAETTKEIDSIGIYFRDLNNGPVFEIDTHTHFIAASLMKLPIVIGFLKQASTDPQLLQKKILYDSQKLDGVKVYSQTIPISDPLVPGQSYTVEDLLKRSIIESDNLAVVLLNVTFPEISPMQILNEMGVPFQIKKEGGAVLVDDFAGIFRILYNASYLDQEKSNLLLTWLTQSKFTDGLRVGVPTHIPVAHKFGERQLDNSKQFHQCGIIYYPGRPYILCMMSLGTDQAHLVRVLSKISKVVYEQVDHDAQSH